MVRFKLSRSSTRDLQLTQNAPAPRTRVIRLPQVLKKNKKERTLVGLRGGRAAGRGKENADQGPIAGSPDNDDNGEEYGDDGGGETQPSFIGSIGKPIGVDASSLLTVKAPAEKVRNI